ncbi:MOSC domain-containing protein [Actibacterium lipolyticum]|uniref:MOSC domain protein n=1 Tax=Actibacterium lipolyticum TaxID=1524263 RepID=A0A238JKR9_9RHOB|nr:MOSC domain-containing protein [Actibacterium lipolyticum]SMX31003.1 MOSC domain protein [Actibacterium lipolyticum]
MERLAQIWRHPIKGIGAEPLKDVALTPNRPLPGDRAWAVLTGDTPDTGEWQPCRNFARGCYAPALMAVRAQSAGDIITLSHPNRPPLSINPRTDGAKLVSWLGPLYPAERPAPRQLIAAPEIGMADADFASVAILSLTSLQALSEKLGKTLDPRRFRGNLWLDGLAPFEELAWVGKTVRIGDVELKVEERIKRCRATEANPETGERDADTLKALRDGWGHTDFGLKATVTIGGTVRLNDMAKVL